MEIPTITAETRKPSGSRAASRLRRSGKVPAIVYGHKEAPTAVSLDYKAIDQHLKHGLHLVKLQMAEKLQPCLLKDAQYDHLGMHLVHLDLARVELDEKVTVHVPLELRGTPKGVGEGGVLRQEMMEIEIECRVMDIPEVVRIKVDDLALNAVLHVKDLKLDEGLVAKNDPETVVCTVREPLVMAATTTEAPAEGAATEPEVIARGKVEEEGADEAEKK